KNAKSFNCNLVWLSFLLWVAFASGLSGQSVPAPQAENSPAGEPELLRSARASRVDRAPKVDGTSNDPLWEQATPISNFLQREPFEGQAPTEQTEVRILYTRREVFFGITCFDSNST